MATFLMRLLWGGWSEYRGKRNIFFTPFDPTDFPASSRTARHSNHGYELAAHLDGGALFRDSHTIRPILGIDYIYAQESGFKEKGAGIIDLQVESASYDLIRGQIGFSAFRCFDFTRSGKGYLFQPEIGLYFMQEWRFHGDSYQARFVNLNCEMTVKGTYPNRSLFVPSAKLSLFSSEIPANCLSLSYQVEIGSSYVEGQVLLEGSFGF
jgi:hypothetical protein